MMPTKIMGKRYSSVDAMLVDMKVPKKVLKRFRQLVKKDREQMVICKDLNGKVRLMNRKTGEYV